MARICLILEATYPYVIGGVSQWVQLLTSGLPDFEFVISHLYTGEKPLDRKYRSPDNVKAITTIPILTDSNYLDLKKFIETIPDADIYHALSTGFAGWLGTQVKLRKKKPLLITEHGIYWHEVEIGADEVECGFKVINTETGRMNLGKTWQTWLETFKSFARESYEIADRITTVCRVNQEKQLSLAANPEKCSIIPNGVQINPLHISESRIKPGSPPSIGFIGRVTPIKDIETFIRAGAKVRERIAAARFYVIGPTDQDVEYYQQCKLLKNELGLSNLEFVGAVDTFNYYRKLDLVVMTSKSEGLPYALLEAMANGIPVVATNVGGCPE